MVSNTFRIDGADRAAWNKTLVPLEAIVSSWNELTLTFGKAIRKCHRQGAPQMRTMAKAYYDSNARKSEVTRVGFGRLKGCGSMRKDFKVGDHVSWNSEAGYVSGRIIQIHTSDTEYKGHARHATQNEPQFEIKSDKTDHIAMHKGSVLQKID